ncbi:hypothetical protein [Amycolatopsis sp. 195334CR]|uniref:hypothetical protein n=1 Tax=Amycolatopsis sp. 195334CR TaxID=2814588 RepID=UPI001A8EDE64|nr:hypothetical protein [Amycolatopsis sp. 195334CR]MBN6036409.1 hypothetical protein [Amycolatopsis sp. 195334CR]
MTDRRSLLADLWRNEQVPIEDALFLADGSAYDLRLDRDAPGGLAVGDRFDLAELLAEDPDWVASIHPLREVGLPAGDGWLTSGEGSQGADGFFARLDAARTPRWVAFLAEGNPFTEITVDGRMATFTSTSGVVVTVDADHPERG